MKHLKLISIFMFVILVGCSNDEPNELVLKDYRAAQVTIYVQDSDGNDLFLNADAYDGILDRENLPAMVSYTYDGETMQMSERGRLDEAKAPQGRAYMPTFYGVYVDYYAYEYPRIRFGEFDGAEDQHEKVIVNWPDGTHTTIEFMSEACNAVSSMKIRLDDGEWMKSTNVTIVK